MVKKIRGEEAWGYTEDSARTVQRHEEKKLGNARKTAKEWFKDTRRRSLGMHGRQRKNGSKTRREEA